MENEQWSRRAQNTSENRREPKTGKEGNMERKQRERDTRGREVRGRAGEARGKEKSEIYK